MPTKKLIALRLDLDLIAGLERVQRDTGAPVAEQARRAIITAGTTISRIDS